MFLSPELELALEQECLLFDAKRLASAAQELSQHYRQQITKMPLRFLKEHCLAYAAVRMPATYQVAMQILTELFTDLPSLSIKSFLDIGAGPGTCAFALAALADIPKITLLEKEPYFLEMGQRFCQKLSDPNLQNASWILENAFSNSVFPKSDIVLASYSLGEMTPPARSHVVDKCIQAAQKIFIAIEPGIPQGFATILEVRDQLIAKGLFIIAPCPHQNPCPVPSPDWCHFSKRLHRSSSHRLIKNVTLPFEDEKYSYLIASKEALPEPAWSRIIKKPMKRPGHIYLDLCTKHKLERTIITRRDKQEFRQAQKTEWGNQWPTQTKNESPVL